MGVPFLPSQVGISRCKCSWSVSFKYYYVLWMESCKGLLGCFHYFSYMLKVFLLRRMLWKVFTGFEVADLRFATIPFSYNFRPKPYSPLFQGTISACFELGRGSQKMWRHTANTMEHETSIHTSIVRTSSLWSRLRFLPTHTGRHLPHLTGTTHFFFSPFLFRKKKKTKRRNLHPHPQILSLRSLYK